MLIAVLLIFLVILTSASHLIFGSAWTGYILNIFSIFLALTFRGLSEFLDKFEQIINKTINLGGVTKTLKYISSALNYFDLSLIILSIFVLSLNFHNSLINSLMDLAAKGFVSFPENKDGLAQLKLYIAGSIFLPTFLVALGLYGFNHGFQLRKIIFSRLFCSILFGVILSVVLISISRGYWTGPANVEAIQKANQTGVPVGSEYVKYLLVIGLLIFFVFLLSGYVWFFSTLGRISGIILYRTEVRKLKDKNKLNINQASKEQLIEILRVSPKIAVEIIELKNQHDKVTPDRLFKIKGIGERTMQRAKENFDFD